MLKSLFAGISAIIFLQTALGAEAEIVGSIQPKCSIHTDANGFYATPTPYTLSTLANDGGSPAIVRYDVVEAGYYKAVITVPNSFTQSPVLTDSIAWTGEVSVNQVTDAAMSAYDTDKRIQNNVTEFDLTVAGSVWFKASSTARYGYNKALPSGTYKAVVTAECVAL